MSVDRLENIMGDYQFAEEERGGGGVDPSDVYLLVFRRLGWSEEKARQAVDDTDTSLEERLLEEIDSPGYAADLLKQAIETHRASRIAEDVPGAPGP